MPEMDLSEASATLLQHGPARTTMLSHVDLELLFRPLQFPLLVSLDQRGAIKAQKLGPDIHVAHQHAAKVSHIADSRVGVGDAIKERQQSHDPDEVPDLHRNDEEEQDLPVREQQ